LKKSQIWFGLSYLKVAFFLSPTHGQIETIVSNFQRGLNSAPRKKVAMGEKLFDMECDRKVEKSFF